jgi:hypothetical protein
MHMTFKELRKDKRYGKIFHKKLWKYKYKFMKD